MVDAPRNSIVDFTARLLSGMMSVLTINNPPLYRYPYRNSSEAFRGDFKRIADDISHAFTALEAHERPE